MWTIVQCICNTDALLNSANNVVLFRRVCFAASKKEILRKSNSGVLLILMTVSVLGSCARRNSGSIMHALQFAKPLRDLFCYGITSMISGCPYNEPPIHQSSSKSSLAYRPIHGPTSSCC